MLAAASEIGSLPLRRRSPWRIMSGWQKVSQETTTACAIVSVTLSKFGTKGVCRTGARTAPKLPVALAASAIEPSRPGSTRRHEDVGETSKISKRRRGHTLSTPEKVTRKASASSKERVLLPFFFTQSNRESGGLSNAAN